MTQAYPYLEVNAVTVSGTTVKGTTVSGTTIVGTESIVSSEIGTGAVLTVHISGGQVTSTHMAANSVLAASLGSATVVSTSIVSGGILVANISGQQVNSKHQSFVGTGSPVTFGNYIQFGAGVLTSASIAWVVYSPAFLAAPNLVLVSANDSAINIMGAGSGTNTGAGSTRVLGTTASTSFNWIACGSL